MSPQVWTETGRLGYPRRDIRQGAFCRAVPTHQPNNLFLKDLFWLAGMLRPYASALCESLLADCSCSVLLCSVWRCVSFPCRIFWCPCAEHRFGTKYVNSTGGAEVERHDAVTGSTSMSHPWTGGREGLAAGLPRISGEWRCHRVQHLGPTVENLTLASSKTYCT